jgi:DNA-binding XRE family transcriptional regulator
MGITTHTRARAVLARDRVPRLRSRSLRVWFGLSQGAFARAVGVSRSTVARWEAHDSGPATNTAEGRILTLMDEIRHRATRIWGRDEGRKWLHDHVVALRARPIDVLVARGPTPVYQVLMELWEGAA